MSENADYTDKWIASGVADNPTETGRFSVRTLRIGRAIGMIIEAAAN